MTTRTNISTRLRRLEGRQEPQERPFVLFGLEMTTATLATVLKAVDGTTRGIPTDRRARP